MPTSEVSLITKVLEIGKDLGTPLGIMFIMLMMWQFLTIFKELTKFSVEAATKFLDRHFKHIDSMEIAIQENDKTATTNTEQFIKAIDAMNSTVAMLNKITEQNTAELKPLIAALVKVESTIRHCEDNKGSR